MLGCMCVFLATVKERSLIRMTAAVINLIRSPLTFALCQSRHHRVTSAQSLPFNDAAALTCSLSTAVATVLTWLLTVVQNVHFHFSSCLKV